ncbi:hypothetical protein AB9F35_34515, partial [Rhizobium leguminosarum]
VRQITMRLAAPGAAASVSLAALGITNELTATLMLSPNGVDTLATKFWSLTSEIDYVSAAPYAFIMVSFLGQNGLIDRDRHFFDFAFQ